MINSINSMNLHVIFNHFSTLYSIKYSHSIRNVSFFFFLNKGIFFSKNLISCLFSLKRCIQACQFSPICVKVRTKRKKRRRLVTFTASNVKNALAALSWASYRPRSAQHGSARHEATVWQRYLTLQLPAGELRFSLSPVFLPLSLYPSHFSQATKLHSTDLKWEPKSAGTKKKTARPRLEPERTDTRERERDGKTNMKRWRHETPEEEQEEEEVLGGRRSSAGF